MRQESPHPVALITGAAAGIGLATAELFVERGHRVVFADRDLTGAQRAASRHDGLAVAVDVTDTEAVGAMIAATLSNYGRLDVLVNNAGVPSSGASAELSDADWTRGIDVNLNGALRCTRAAYPALARARGSVVMMSSVSALVGMPSRLVYTAAKAALLGMTRVLAVEWAPDIRVNAVAPGYVQTAGFHQRQGPEAVARLSAQVPMARMVAPEEVAEAVHFLAGPRASAITGQCLVVDGGLSIAADS